MRLKRLLIITAIIVLAVTVFVIFGPNEPEMGVETNGRPTTEGELQPDLAMDPNAPALTDKSKVNFIKEGCADLVRMFGSQSALSTIQEESRWPQYQGQPFKWDLIVIDVRDGSDGGYVAYFGCSRDNTPEIAMSFPAELKSEVMRFTPGNLVKLEGVLVGYSGGLLQAEALLRFSAAKK